MKSLLLSLAVGAVMFASPVFAADALKGALDGKTFTVEMRGTDGKTTENTFAFKDGKVECAVSKAAGFQPAEYTTKAQGAETVVTAEFKNAKGDTQTIHGVVAQNRMTGTVDVSEGGKISKLTFAPKPVAVAKTLVKPSTTPHTK